MDCKQFRVWLMFREPTNRTLADEEREHVRSCAACTRLLTAADQMDETLGEGLKREEVPARLRASVALLAEEPSRQQRRPRWVRRAVPSAALAGVALLLLVFLPFGQDLTSIEKIARLAEQNHLAGYTMMFRADEVAEISDWFRSKLPFEVVKPALTGRGLKFLGGRKCSLGDENIAYLFYTKDGKRYSLFELDSKNVQVELLENRVYRYPVGDCIVEIWKETDRVFVLVV